MENKKAGYNFYYFGNSDWYDLPGREHHLALHLAKRKHKVMFIEEMPSVAKKIKIQSGLRKKYSPYYLHNPEFLNIITPPTIPTYFRSSLTPLLDKMIFRHWFNLHIKPEIIITGIAIISSPVWFYLLGDKISHFDYVIYDVYDDLKISSRNNRALKYLNKCETTAAAESDLILCSALALSSNINKRYNTDSKLLRNAVEKSYFAGQIMPAQKNKIIGLVGSLDVKPCVYNIDLICKVASYYQDFKVEIIGRITQKQKELFSNYTNIHCPGVLTGRNLREHINSFSVCLIPFVNSEISKTINPLKMYEYLSSGKPVASLDNFDYADAGNLLYLANSDSDFIDKIGIALDEKDEIMAENRIKYVKENTWEKRTDELLDLIDNNFNPPKGESI